MTVTANSQSTDDLVKRLRSIRPRLRKLLGITGPTLALERDVDDGIDTIERLQRELLDQERELMHKEDVIKRQMGELASCNARLDQLSVSELALVRTNAQLRSNLSEQAKTIEALEAKLNRVDKLVERIERKRTDAEDELDAARSEGGKPK